MSGIEAAGYVTCTPVQEHVLQAGIDGSNLYVQSQTGTGKTAAYLITVLQRMLDIADSPQQTALILVPTRELAVQVEQEACTLAQDTKLRIASFYGGVGYHEQEQNLKEGVNLIIGTPGRVIDLEKSGTMRLKTISFLIIDEADRMFDMGFYPDLRILLHTVSAAEERQTMLFSATLNTWVKNLAWEYTRDAKEITIDADSVTVDEINQTLFHVAAEKKMPLLLGLLKKENPENAIVFCNTKKSAEIIAKRLDINGYKTGFLIGDLPQPKRLKIIEAVKNGKISCLVATDVAARGIDISDLNMVINYDLPTEAENYVHRIGRTARAGKSGTAYSLCSEQDVYSLPDIEKYLEAKIPAVVPADDDFGEDKSAGMYIQLDSYGSNRRGEADENNSRPRKGYNAAGTGNRKQQKPHVKPSKQPDSQRRAAGKPVKHGQAKPNKPYANKTTEYLETLSFEERMAYYKKQYAGHLTENTGEQAAKTAEAADSSDTNQRRKNKTGKNHQPNNQKQAKGKKKANQVRQKTDGQGSSAKKAVQKPSAAAQKNKTAKASQKAMPAAGEKQDASQKGGMLRTLKRLFFGK